MYRFLLYIISLAFALPAFGQTKARLTVKTIGTVPRQEVVAFNAADVWKTLGVKEGTPLIVRNAYRQQVTSQVTYDRKLLVEVSVLPGITTKFTVEAGEPMKYERFVDGQLYKWRVDDFTWENDKCAYRAYGPALQKTGEKAFGFDVWLKSTPYLDVEKRYARVYQGNFDVNALRKAGKKAEADSVVLATSLHLDHGTGLDCYNVGPSLGCGTPALMLGDSIVLPWCYESCNVLDNGPLRFSIELVYPATQVGKLSVKEHRLVSLSKGSYFNEISVWYEGLGKKQSVDVCGGVVVHTNLDSDLTLAKDYIAYVDPTDSPWRHNFHIYTAVLFPDGECKTMFVKENLYKKCGIVGNAVGVRRGLKKDEKFTYWFGASWPQSGTGSQKVWLAQIQQFLDACRQPLVTDIEKQ